MIRVATFAVSIVIVVVAVGASSLLRGEDEPNNVAKEADAGKLLASWAAPGAPENRGTTRPPDQADLAMENYEVDEPFAKVWAFYAAKSGCKQEYHAGKNIGYSGF
jgi:hypothetical protein